MADAAEFQKQIRYRRVRSVAARGRTVFGFDASNGVVCMTDCKTPARAQKLARWLNRLARTRR